MNSAVNHRSTCRLCESGNVAVVLRLLPSALADSYVGEAELDVPQPRYPLDLTLCKDCGFVFIPDVVDPETIYRDYVYVTTSSMGLADHFEAYANDVLRRIHPANGALVVDIGSNDGTLLAFFRAAGLRVLGIEPAREIARAATNRGVETIPEFFTVDLARELRRRHGAAAIVTVNNLFANIDDLRAFVLGVREWLSPDGVFIFESSYLGDMIDNMVFDFVYHEHLSYLSVKPLASFFRHMGMELIDLLPVPTKGGSLRYTVQLAGGPRRTSEVVGEYLAREARSGIGDVAAFERFAAAIDQAKRRLSEFLAPYRRDGKRVAAYGGSATSTTLIHQFELDNLEFIADDNPAKHNKFSPGYHIPVLPSAALYEKKPDCVVLLAWRYSTPIVEKHREFVRSGGLFVVPLPELRVISS